ncbi:GNAT family N-acetyltransferase [Candidatus Woesearchaeota archaeon]|nr:GNAT family N-acetyltransferase [Candidatus Woesearchaeota archaeon]
MATIEDLALVGGGTDFSAACIVRQAILADAPQIKAWADKYKFSIASNGFLEAKGMLLPITEQRVIEVTLQNGFYVAANPRIIGCNSLVEYADIAEMRTLAVDGQYQKRGIGGLLVRAVAEEALARGHSQMLTLTKRENVPIFERWGFVTAQNFPASKYQQDCADCRLMEYGLCDEIPMIMTLK